MTKYLVTNIKLDSMSGSQTIQYDVPAAVNEIYYWLEEYHMSNVTDSQAYAIWLRSVLFYSKEMTYDFIKLVDTDNKVRISTTTHEWLADLADLQYKETVQRRVEINIPQYVVVDIDDEELATGTNSLEQLIFEHLIQNMHVDIKVKSLTEIVLDAIREQTNVINAVAPDIIAQAAVDYLPDMTDHDIEDIYNAVWSLTAALIDEPGQYK